MTLFISLPYDAYPNIPANPLLDCKSVSLTFIVFVVPVVFVKIFPVVVIIPAQLFVDPIILFEFSAPSDFLIVIFENSPSDVKSISQVL